MKLIEIDIDIIEKCNESDKRKWAKVIVQQFYEIGTVVKTVQFIKSVFIILGFLRCVNIPEYNEDLLLKAAQWFHLEHSKEQKMKLASSI